MRPQLSCLWYKRNQCRVAAPGELLEGAMERHLTTGVQKADALQSAPGKRRKVSSGPIERAEPGSLGRG